MLILLRNLSNFLLSFCIVSSIGSFLLSDIEVDLIGCSVVYQELTVSLYFSKAGSSYQFNYML